MLFLGNILVLGYFNNGLMLLINISEDWSML